jgi:hypothetical protein
VLVVLDEVFRLRESHHVKATVLDHVLEVLLLCRAGIEVAAGIRLLESGLTGGLRCGKFGLGFGCGSGGSGTSVVGNQEPARNVDRVGTRHCMLGALADRPVSNGDARLA